ncbi:MAG: ATP-binding protein [Ignavibacteriales bacterium]
MSENKIGKKILENLTRGMYEDSKIIYREYIQNSAYQIFTAIANNTFNDELFIDIKIDAAKRNIYIKDNATGIPRELVPEKLSNVADSEKNEEIGLGFRGIGRLGGLAYCDKLRFITTAVGDDTMTIMTWDAKELNRILDDKSIKDDATEVLRRIISYEYEPCDVNEHFFIVELINISEDNTELLSIEMVRKYIAMNAPVPFGPKFHYKHDVLNYIDSKRLPRNEYVIYVNGEDISKPYSTTLYKKINDSQKEKYDEIYTIKIKEFFTDNGEMLAWMWYGISRFEKQIPFPLNEMAGIRLRQANIQIGNERTLAPLFKENRGNLYFVGEIHAVHKDLTPNARRDYFNENATINDLEAQLEYFFKEELYKTYHYANDVKNTFKKELDFYKKQDEFERKQGKFVSVKEQQKFEKALEIAAEEKEKSLKEIAKYESKGEDNDVLRVVFSKIKDKHKKAMNENGFDNNIKQNTPEIQDHEPTVHSKKKVFLTQELTHLAKEHQKLISRIYEVIIQNLPPDKSEELISKIQEELKHGKKSTSN